MKSVKTSITSLSLFVALLIFTTAAKAQLEWGPALTQGNQSFSTLQVPLPNYGFHSSTFTSPLNQSYGYLTSSTAPAVNNQNRKTTSLTVGHIADEFDLVTDYGSRRFRFDGETSGLMLSSKSASFMLGYGLADAYRNEGEIRSITADLNFGGNITLFRNFFGLPVGGFLPIRVNLGYRNLELLDAPESRYHNTANIAATSLGGGVGAEIRLPTGLPVLEDNLTAFATLVSSVGGLGDLTSADTDGLQSDNTTALNGLRLTKHTDFNIEAKFERLLGGNIGVTAGLTLRWLHWTDEEAEDFKQVLDIISGEEEDISLRATQSFFRVGINW